MKLLLCLDCGDIFNLGMPIKTCSCGKTSGKYVDELNVQIKGNCKVIGFNNNSFRRAHELQKIEDKHSKINTLICCQGQNFEAFFIPENATSIKRI